MILSRMVVVESMIDAEIELVERFHLAPPGGGHGCRIRLPRFSSHEFPATRFYNRNLVSGRASAIIPYINGVESSPYLIPQDFLQYVKLLFYLNHRGELTIAGITPRFTDFGRFWGLGFLGRQYRGRGQIIIR